MWLKPKLPPFRPSFEDTGFQIKNQSFTFNEILPFHKVPEWSGDEEGEGLA